MRDLLRWWSVTIDHAHGRTPRDRGDIVWPGTGETVGHTVAWVNAELMKNVTEIGQLRMLRAA